MKKLYMMILLGFVFVSLFGCMDSVPPNGTDTEKNTEATVPQDTLDENISAETTVPPKTEQYADPYLAVFRDVIGENDFCAVSCLGYLDGSYYEIMSHIEDLGMLEEFPFLEIPKENYLPLEGGELYAVIPADADATVTVYTGVMDETDFTVKAERKLAEFIGGAPVLLKCNVSEIMPNVVLEITENGRKYTYSPSLSGENGKLVETEGVYDFSPYDVLLAGLSDGSDYVFCGKWLTNEPDMKGDLLTLLLDLMPGGGAEYACGPVNSEYTDMYVGTWSYDTQKEMIRLSLEEVLMDGDTTSDRLPHTLNCGFTWEIDGSAFNLTHTEGDEILNGSWGGTFRFMNEFDFYNEPKG